LAGCPAPPTEKSADQPPNPYAKNGSDAEEDVFPVVGRRYCLAGKHVRISSETDTRVRVVDGEVPAAVILLSEHPYELGSSINKYNWYEYASPDQDPCPSRSYR
jgi:hypothetical protein